eukprot:CAMPEP_0197897350 /NCGR_PEP_ID=MMETSP1439-20131203/42138_1 /TAXON_ID=66791 /ORGANISM="Gonyaulax spinifera, Strain CCMP409" /LENGTH=49 /DNA_ID= /DNA_START= /DNA_END= /DNA_ORIENTATION=
MARRSASALLAAVLCVATLWALVGLVAPCFVAAPSRSPSVQEPVRLDQA